MEELASTIVLVCAEGRMGSLHDLLVVQTTGTSVRLSMARSRSTVSSAQTRKPGGAIAEKDGP